MQYLRHRVLPLSAAGAVSFYMLRNCNKKSTVFATQVSEDDIRTTRSQRQTGSKKPGSITDRVTFSLIDNTTNEPFENGLELLNVQVFFRHGARTPLKNLPGLKEVNYDRSFLMTYVPYSRVNHVIENIKGGPRPESTYDKRYAANYFRGGCFTGMLTALGRDQMYMFGRQLRSLYIEKLGLLDKEFNPKQIKIRSTNYNRCIESLESVIAGLYGQNSFDNRDPLVIPVSDEKEEILCPNIPYCPIMQTIEKEGYLYLANLEGYQNVVHEISHRLGIQLDPKEVDMIMWRDNIMVRQTLGLPVPKTLLEILPEIDYYGTHALEIIVRGHPKESDFLMRLSGMPISQLIEKNIRNACYSPASAPKLQLYACHDSSIVLLLSMLGCFDHHWPPYSADIRLELYEAPGCEDRYWMKILYCNKAVVMPEFNSEEFPYICMTMFYQLLKRYKVTSMAEYFRMKGCNAYSISNAGESDQPAVDADAKKEKESHRPKKRRGFWS